MHRLTRCDYQCLDRGLALIEVLFCDLSQPVHAILCNLDCSFGIAFSEIGCTFGHSFASFTRGALAKCQLMLMGFTACSAWLQRLSENDECGEQFPRCCLSKNGRVPVELKGTPEL
jgi:hypothetical protein